MFENSDQKCALREIACGRPLKSSEPFQPFNYGVKQGSYFYAGYGNCEVRDKLYVSDPNEPR